MAVNEQAVEISSERRDRTRGARSLRSAIEARPALSIFAVAFLLRVLAIPVLGLFPDSYVFAVDNTTYSGMATSVVTGAADNWDEGTWGLYNSTFTFMAPVTLIYALTDSNEVIARIFVALLGAGTAALVTRLGVEFLPRMAALGAGLAVAFLPSQVLWSSLLLKDAAVWAVLAGMAVAVALAGKKTGIRMIAWVLVAAALLFSLRYLRAHTTVVAAWALGVAGFAGIKTQRLGRGALTLTVAVMVPWFAGLGFAGTAFVASAGSLEYRRAANALDAQSAFVEALNLGQTAEGVTPPPELLAVEEEITRLESKLTKAGTGSSGQASAGQASAGQASAGQASAGQASAGQASAGQASPPEVREQIEKKLARLQERKAALVASATPVPPPRQPTGDEGFTADVAHLPKGLSVMLLEPFPWSSPTSPTFQLARWEAVVWYPLLVLVLLGLWRARSHLRVMTFPLLAGGGMLLVYALAEGNIGTAFRHRGEFVWVVALLAGVGLQQVAGSFRRGNSVSMGEG